MMDSGESDQKQMANAVSLQIKTDRSEEKAGQDMDIVSSVAGIVNMERPGQGLTDLIRADFRLLMPDLGMFAHAEALDNEKYRPDLMRKYYRNFMEEVAVREIGMPVIKMPFFSHFSKHTDTNERILRINLACLSACGYMAGRKYVIVQPLFTGVAPDREWEENRRYYLTLAEHYPDTDIKILLINQYKNHNGHILRGICSDGETAAKWVDDLNREAGTERFGFCMDTGNCNLCGQNMQRFVQELGNRLKAVILTENDGNRDIRMLPFSYTGGLYSGTDWLGLVRGLRRSGFDGYLILEMAHTLLSFSPLLRLQVLKLGRSVADYIAMQTGMENALKKYASVVLFGAGNMCRNYMKCYGEKYPPLFTCDNDNRLWGTEFCGLEVRKPEALKGLPDDCGVFICNTYYREIETQLREMGIKNIEYFNDEYMPSFFFDRLERER